MKNFKRNLSIFLCLFVFFANTNALCAKAAPLNKPDSNKIASAIDNTAKSQHSGSSNYYDNLKNGKFTFIKSFQISGVDAPQNGHLLDGTATVTADNGYSWEIPVLWVNNDGDLVKVAIEVDESTRSYPVFAFYLPQGYALTFGEKSSYDIRVPDFVNALFNKTGVATLSNPDRGITYITPLLPGKDRVLVRVPSNYYEEAPQCSGSEGGGSEGGIPYNDDPSYPWPSIVDPDSFQYENYNPDFSADQVQDIANRHGSPEAIAAIGADNVAWLVSYIKDVIEPEAVALLIQSFPAYTAAAANGELGKDLGVYIYYSDKEKDQAVAYVKATPDNSTGAVKYVLAVNSYYYYSLDGDELKSNPEFTDNSDIELDTTIIHEIMHALMDDYTRTGMLGMQYVEGGDFYTYSEEAEFPEWFVEGIATSVGSPYQYWNNTLKSSYGYDGTGYSNLLEAYLDDEEMHLDYSDGKSLNGDSDIRKSAYVSGYLANVYLGYLAARKYDGIDAITEYENGDYSINSLVIRSGVNHILEELHNGKTLDDIILEISDFGDTILYLDTDDFADKFIASDEEGIADNGISLAFTTKFLNYLEGNSIGEFVANGSILTDFTDVSPTLLSPDLLANPQLALKLTESKEQVASTVDSMIALESGGKSETGIVTEEDFDEKLVAFPDKNVAMAPVTTAAPAQSSSADKVIKDSVTDKESKAAEQNPSTIVADKESPAAEQDQSITVTDKKSKAAEQNPSTIIADSGTEKEIKESFCQITASENTGLNQNASPADKTTAHIDQQPVPIAEKPAVSKDSIDSKEIGSILDAIQTGIDEHNEMAERTDTFSDVPTTAATSSAASEDGANPSLAQATGDGQQEANVQAPAASLSEASNSGTDGNESNGTNGDVKDSSSCNDDLTADTLTDAQSIRNALASGQINSFTPEQLAILAADQSSAVISESDKTDSLSDTSKEQTGKDSTAIDTADNKNSSPVQTSDDPSVVSTSDPGSIANKEEGKTTTPLETQNSTDTSPDTSQEAAAVKADESQNSSSVAADTAQQTEHIKVDESQVSVPASTDSAQESEHVKVDESQVSVPASTDSAQESEHVKVDESQVSVPVSTDSAQETGSDATVESPDILSSSTDSAQVTESGKADSQENEGASDDKTQDDPSATPETRQENGLTDSGSAVTIDELENTPVEISVSGPEPEADDTTDNSSDDQQILDALPASDDNDSENDSAADTAPPVE